MADVSGNIQAALGAAQSISEALTQKQRLRWQMALEKAKMQREQQRLGEERQFKKYLQEQEQKALLKRVQERQAGYMKRQQHEKWLDVLGEAKKTEVRGGDYNKQLLEKLKKEEDFTYPRLFRFAESIEYPTPKAEEIDKGDEIDEELRTEFGGLSRKKAIDNMEIATGSINTVTGKMYEPTPQEKQLAQKSSYSEKFLRHNFSDADLKRLGWTPNQAIEEYDKLNNLLKLNAVWKPNQYLDANRKPFSDAEIITLLKNGITANEVNEVIRTAQKDTRFENMTPTDIIRLAMSKLIGK